MWYQHKEALVVLLPFEGLISSIRDRLAYNLPHSEESSTSDNGGGSSSSRTSAVRYEDNQTMEVVLQGEAAVSLSPSGDSSTPIECLSSALFTYASVPDNHTWV